MKNSMKKWMLIAVFMILLGCAAFVGALASSNWDFAALGHSKYGTVSYEITEEFQNITVEGDTEDIEFVRSDDETCRVTFFEREKELHTAEVNDGTLFISLNDTRAWYEHISLFSIGSPRITLTLPQAAYDALTIKESTGDIALPANLAFVSVDIEVSTGDVSSAASTSGLTRVSTSTGDIRLDSLSAGTLDLSVSTGRVDLQTVTCEESASIRVTTGNLSMKDVSCGSLTSNGSTGGVRLENVEVSGAMTIERSTGNVRFEHCDAAELSIRTSTGSVSGSLMTDKIFVAHSDTGRVTIPDTTSGGRCEIRTDTGHIDISID